VTVVQATSELSATTARLRHPRKAGVGNHRLHIEVFAGHFRNVCRAPVRGLTTDDGFPYIPPSLKQ